MYKSIPKVKSIRCVKAKKKENKAIDVNVFFGFLRGQKIMY